MVVWSEVKKHLLTGVSYMIPLVVASGLCMAIAKILGGPLVGNAEGTIPWYINSIGGIGMNLVVPMICAYVAYSIADRLGIAPGLICGAICVQIKAGFIGGIIAAFLVGYTVLFLKKYLKVPKAMQGLLPVMLIPLLTTLFVGLILYLFIGMPIAWMQENILAYMKEMQGGSRFVMGSLIGGMMGFDLGGPINKTASLFCNALMVEGYYDATAAKIIGGMTPPLGVALAVLIWKEKKFSRTEIEAGKAAFPLGLCFITEGVLPFALADPLRVIPATMLGSAVSSGLSVLWGCTSTVPHGGIFVVPIMGNPMQFMLALLIGSVVTAAVLSILKPNLKEKGCTEEIVEGAISEKDINMNF